ncbi:MAG: hypothetical protein FJ298_01425 [Planctomycetes bacterium]|nr:hypothetical protein [Planctomycetota bacterium]
MERSTFKSGSGEALPPRWVAGLARALPWLVAAACLLRLVGLERWGLWIDEAFTLHDSGSLSWTKVTDFPFNLFLMSRWLSLLEPPHGEASLRAPACLFGVLSILGTAWAFRPLLGAPRSWLAAALVALSSNHLFWSQSARHYTLAQALSVLGTGVALRAIQGGSGSRFVAGVALALSAAFAHPSAGLVVPALLVAPWLCGALGARLPWMPSRRWMVALAVAGLALGLTWGADVWAEYARKKSGSSVLHLALTTGFYFGPPLSLAAAWMSLEALRQRKPAGVLVGLVLVVSFGLALVAALLARVAAQYVFVLLPWAAAAASGIAPFERRRGKLALSLLVAMLAWGSIDVALYLTVRHGDRPRWKEAYALVARLRGPDDLVFGMAAPVGEYYLSPGSTRLREASSLARLTDFEDHLVDVWARRERRIWIVLNREDLLDWTREKRERFERFLREQCERVRTFPVAWTPRELDVEVYLRP